MDEDIKFNEGTIPANHGLRLTFQPSKLSVGDLSFDGIGNLLPQPDITPLEATHLSMMLALSVANVGFIDIDFKGWVTEKKLERHFTNV